MRTAIRLALVFGLALLPAATADARAKAHKAPAPRPPRVRNGIVKVPSIPRYNMGSIGRGRGMGMSGGNLRAYEQIMKESMIIQQQQYVIQQQRYMMQQMQNQAKAKGQAASPGASSLVDPNAEPVYHRKKYNHGPVDPNFKPKTD